MKQVFTKSCVLVTFLSLSLAANADIEVNKVNFPDDGFRSQIFQLAGSEDGILTDEEIAGIKDLSVHNPEVQSLKGVEYLTGLTSIGCNSCLVTELDFSANTALEVIDINLTALEKINVTGLTSLKYLICQKTFLSSLDVSSCTALEYLYCRGGRLTTLDLSNNTNLKELDCSENQLTSLILPESHSLNSVNCSNNAITGATMDALITSLPEVAQGSFYVKSFFSEAGSEPDKNVCTEEQTDLAMAKHWTVYATNDGTEWYEYAGSSTTGIRSATRQEQSVDSYSINGIVLSPSHSHKGIVIQNGRKVVVK